MKSARLSAAARRTAPKSASIIRSTMDDPTLLPFLRDYIQGLPAQVAIMESCIAKEQWEQLSTTVHNLRGTGGLYGLLPITNAAATAEALLNERAEVEAIRSGVDELIAIMRRVEGFSTGEVVPQSEIAE